VNTESKTIKQQHYTFEMRVPIEDGVYNLLEVKIELCLIT